MARVALVGVEHRDDDLETRAFALRFASLLKSNGDQVSVLLAHSELGERVQESPTIDGVDVRMITPRDVPQFSNRWPDLWVVRLSEYAATLIRSVDVAYFLDYANPGFHIVREKRFTTHPRPVCITVLNGPSAWIRARSRQFPSIPESLNVEFVERYAARYSDFVVATSMEILNWASAEHWQFAAKPQVLALPDKQKVNDQWLAFHNRVTTQYHQPHVRQVAIEPASHAIDVCITYYEKTRYLPQLLKALEHQSFQRFQVIAVDDGSPSEDARAVFTAMAEKYAGRGWKFIRQENAWVDAARNAAAKQSSAEYLLMIDADDVPALTALERMWEAAQLSGADCLVSGTCLFAGDDMPYDLQTCELTAPVFGFHMPLGANLTMGMLEGEIFGGPMIFIRRKVFEAIGGYREMRGFASEDWELHARLALQGYATDVIPEYLHYYRQLPDSLSRTSDAYLAKHRITETYDRHFAALGLYGVGSAMQALYSQSSMTNPTAAVWPRDRFRPSEFAADDAGPSLLAFARRLYRRALPLDRRLRLHARLSRLMGRGAKLL